MERNIVMISIDKLVDFSDHPYKVIDDAAMDELCASIRTVGVLEPIIVRPNKNGSIRSINQRLPKRTILWYNLSNKVYGVD